MELEQFPDPERVARRAAAVIAASARESVSQRGRFALAVSGGTTPWKMLRALADEDLPWEAVHLFQVDERVAPDGDPDRNLTHLRESLSACARCLPERIHPMPVGRSDLEAAAKEYARALADVAGTPPVLDLVHLGLGSDGHTASLVPGDAALELRDRDVTVTEAPYQGQRRMTFTFPLLDRARRRLWLVTGESKAGMLRRLCDGDPTIPAGRVAQQNAIVFVDRAAASLLRRSGDDAG
jgi:6-phosphogluconolactonase